MSRKLPKIISQEEFELLFGEVEKLERKAKKKSKKLRLKQYRLAMLLGFEAGMRISELLGYTGKSRRKNKTTEEIIVNPVNIPALAPEQVDKEKIIILSGKGGKDRVVARPKRMNESARLMLPLKLKRRALQDFITKLGKRILNKEISFHTLRHGFATHYYNKTKDVFGLQQALGHSRTDTTSIYAHTNPEETIKKMREVF